MFSTATAEPAPSKAASTKPARRGWRGQLLRLGAIALVLWFAWQVGLVLFGGNVHVVIPGKLIRGAQPSAQSLDALIDQYQIRTVLNVRGCCWPDQWYLAESAVCEQRGVNMEDVCFSAVHLPSRYELKQLIDVLDRAEPPIFVHCRHGADRTGIACMTAYLLLDDQTYDSAHRQLSIRYGHAPVGKTTVLDRFMQLYADWLKTTNQEHAPKLFRHWVLNEYRGGWCDADFEKVERLFAAPRLRTSLEFNVVVRNTSNVPWHFKPLKTAGHHVTFKVMDEHETVIFEGRAGMIDRIVAPGEKIQLVMVVPPIAVPGTYRLLVDMIEEGHCWFHQTGSAPWEEELTIRE